MKYKVLKEFERFYLAESPSGWKETFLKYEYKPDEDGYIEKRREYNYKGNPNAQRPKNTPWKTEKHVYESADYEIIYFGEFLNDK